MVNFPDLKGKQVLITGAASGIGAAQVAAFVEQGAKVSAIDRQPLNQAMADVIFYQVDVSDTTALKTVLEKILKTTTLDIVCNTAGILDQYKPTLETTSEAWDHLMAVNLKSQFLITNQVLPKMVERQKGVFVNMASIAGLVAGGGGAAYTAAKHAVVGYTKQLDYDYAAQGIRANCIAPGAIETPMNAADFAGDGAMAKSVAEQTPAKRWAQPEEVAALTLYLASDAADYVHGTVVPIDGGWLER